MTTLIRQRPQVALALIGVAASWKLGDYEKNALGLTTGRNTIAACEAAKQPVPEETTLASTVQAPSWVRRKLLAPIGIPLPMPRVVTPKDPALTLSNRYVKRRQNDELRMRQLLEEATSARGDPEKIKVLGERLFEVTYGKGVTAQEREDFLVQYGCTGWNDKVLNAILEVSQSRGIVEMGAGHGQWARALSEAYAKTQTDGQSKGQRKKKFDFVLAYDDQSNLPLNTHIYNPYTQPHHDFFGNVRKLETQNDMLKVLRSWACRGRVLLLVYPPPGPMAGEVVRNYVEAAEDNDTIVFVGEGRGGANGDDALFDYFENGDWLLLNEMEVERPPGDKGYEKLCILQKVK